MNLAEWILWVWAWIVGAAFLSVGGALVFAVIKIWKWKREQWRDHSADKS